MLPGPQSHRLQEDRQEGTIGDIKKEAGKGIAVCFIPMVWVYSGQRPDLPGYCVPSFWMSWALTLHHAARRRRRGRSKADPVVHWPGGSLGRTAFQCSRAPHRGLTTLTAQGATGGHCKNHRKYLSNPLASLP